MRIIFFGTPVYVLPILDALHKTFKSKSGESAVVAVVTQKPKPVGRKKAIEYSTVDKWAYKKGIRVHYGFNNLPWADLGILASYSKIIPNSTINHFSHGILNIHPSLLPKYRGASPVPATLVAGEKETGVSFIKLDNELDHGPIVAQFKEEVLDNDTTETLRNRLFEKSAEVLVSLLPAYLKGKITPREQNHKSASFTHQISKQDAFISPQYLNACFQGRSLKARWDIPFLKTKSSQAPLMKNYSLVPNTYSLERFIRAMQPWPVAWTHIQLMANSKQSTAKRLKILSATVDRRLKVVSLALEKVQLEGKNPVSWKQFKQGYPNSSF